MAAVDEEPRGRTLQAETGRAEGRLTIGAVCAMVKREFPDISISKIRYLEDRGLLQPRRTQGGYRLYSGEDVERLRTILRLQREEFLPLRVIRDELDRPKDAPRGPRRRRRAAQVPEGGITFAELVKRSGASNELVRELEEFSLLAPRAGFYRPEDAQIVEVATAFAAFGVGARHLRAFHSAIQREAGLLEQLLSPALRSRNADRRAQGLEQLETLAGLCAELTELVLLRDLRAIAQAAE
jgi:DNA-binding transcriptional MerR regulator